MWQLDAFRMIEDAAIRHGAVCVHSFGSVAAGTVDDWSDIDALVVVPDGDLATFWPDRGWLPAVGGIGEPVAYKHWPFQRLSGVTQVLLDNGRHLDIMVIEASAAEERLALLADLRPVTGLDALDNIANELLFDAMGAVARGARGERLLATQLAVRLLDHCLTAAMVIRDVSTGTCVHPRPATQDALVDLLPAIPIGPQPDDILRLVTAAFDCFDQITAGATYEPNFPRAAIDRLIQRAATRV